VSGEHDNTNRGVLFRNDRKAEGSKQPDYRGEGNYGGTDFEIAGWLRDSARGTKFLSLSFQPKRDAANQAPRKPQEEDVPF